MTLSADKLLPGDVLLFGGDTIIGWAIRFFDGTPVNHAGLYVGDGKVNEALGSGLTARSLAESTAGNKMWVRRLKKPAPTMQPVLGVAQAYLGSHTKYGFSEIILLLFLSLTRKVTASSVFYSLVRSLLDKSAAILDRILAGQEKHMICSEFVFRCYDEADPSKYDVYTLHIAGFSYQELLKAMALQAPARAMLMAPARGAHPESLLSLLASRSARHWLSPRLQVAQLAAAPEPTDEEINELLLTYREEVTSPDLASRLGPMEIPLEDLRARVDHFANQLKAVMAPEKAAFETFDQGLQFLASPEVVCNFITPGDLFNCDNLATVIEDL